MVREQPARLARGQLSGRFQLPGRYQNAAGRIVSGHELRGLQLGDARGQASSRDPRLRQWEDTTRPIQDRGCVVLTSSLSERRLERATR